MTDKYRFDFFILLFAALTICLPADAVRIKSKVSGNTVTVTVPAGDRNRTKKIRLQFVSDSIVRVTETPERKIRDRESLIILPWVSEKGVTPQVHRTPQVLTASTAALAVQVSEQGTVSFSDARGNRLTGQTCPTSFAPVKTDVDHGYSTVSRFDTDSVKGVFGLGQHQSDDWNYKGKNEQLFQYNTKVSIPFIVTEKGWGILFDSYSMGRFGNTQDYMQLGQVFKLRGKDSKDGVLTGTYKSAYGNSQLVRDERQIYFADAESIKDLPAFNLNGANVLYEGTLEPQQNGVHDFILYYAGYIKVFIDNEEVVPERWRTAWNPNSYKFSCDMQQGRAYNIRIEWKPDGGTSYCALRAYAPVDAAERQQLTVWNEMNPSSDFYFIYGGTMDGVIKGLHTLVGGVNMLPRWAYGYWQSREHYHTQKEILETAAKFKELGIGIDNIVQDWNYWREPEWGSHEFDPDRYPNPKMMVDSLHHSGIHLMLSVWPKFYASTEHFKEFDAKGWMYKRAIQDSIRDWIGPGYIGSFYDAYSPGAQKLFWNQLKEHLYPLGIDAWWMDASEPNIRDCVPMSYWKALCGPTALGSSTQYLNAYSLMNAKAIYEGLRTEDPDKRVFQLTRSGFAGLQRYSTATWSGDIGTRWEDMRSQITAGLNYSLCGNPYWTMDIGGFCVENRYANAQRVFDHTGRETPDLKEWRELQTRWFQFGTFAPLFRAHGQFPLREPWNIAPVGSETYNAIKYCIDTRYRLMPYIYSLAGKAWKESYTIMRGLVMDYASDENAINIDDQFMFGPGIMVCPVYKYGALERQVYFPAGKVWYALDSLGLENTSVFNGGCSYSVPAPYNRIPLFAPAGAIIIENGEQSDSNEYIVHIFGGENGSFTLYQDDGLSFGYECGQYSEIPFTYNDSASALTIGNRIGNFEGMPHNLKFAVMFHSADGIQKTTVEYNGEHQTIRF